MLPNKLWWRDDKPNKSMTATLQSLYAALAKKSIHAWAGMISRRYKELYTGRQAKNLTKLPIRVELDASSKNAKKKAAMMKNEETETKVVDKQVLEVA